MHDRVPRAVAVVAFALTLLGCSKNNDATSTVGSTAPVVTTATTAVGAAALPKTCDDATLGPVVTAKHPGAQLGELVCDGPFAVATVRNGAGIVGDGVMLARYKAGSWTLVASGEIGPDPQRLVPADFGASAFSAWRGKYELVIHPAPPTTKGASSGGGKSNTTQALYYIPGCTPTAEDKCTTDQNPGGGGQPVGPNGPTSIPHE